MNYDSPTVSHTIRTENFKYGVLKGELSKGSSISKSTHPLSEVENFKKRLLQRNSLKDMHTHWTLRKPIRTGLLMAVNLHNGQLISKNPYKQDIFVNEADAVRLKGKFPEKQLCVSDSFLVMNSLRDTLRFCSTNIMEIDKGALTNHGADNFGRDEAFVLKILQERGIVSSSARHGLSDLKEADIVDEAKGEQYEILFEFKTELSKSKMKKEAMFSPEMQLVQLVDNPYIHPSRALQKKLKKEYTSKFRSNLVILTFGTKSAIISMLEALSEKIKSSDQVYFNFACVYIIAQDFIAEEAILTQIAPFSYEVFSCKNEDLGFIQLTPIKFDEMQDTNSYLMICEHIFDNSQRCRYDRGKELKAWAKDLRIVGTTD